MERLTAMKAKSLSKPGRYRADPTLYLNISPNGAKSWVQRLTINGVRCDIGLGSFALVSLEKARRRAFENRVAVADGIDPQAEKRRAKVPTFREAAEKTIAALAPRWRSAKGKKNWETRLEKYAMPHLGDLRVNEIGREHVLKILTPLWGQKIETARKLRQYLKSIFAWAQSHGFIETNNAGEILDAALPAMPAVQSNFRALPYRGEFPPRWKQSEASNGAAMSAKAGPSNF